MKRPSLLHGILPLALVPVLVPLATPGVSEPAQEATSRSDVDRLVAHYEAVERELRANTPQGLSAEQLANRAQLIEAFRAYRLRGDFGRNEDFPGERKLYFVDNEGRRCAVADLMHVTGDDAIVSKIADTNNHAFVAELAADAALGLWLESVGLTVEEAARIQGPAVNPQRERFLPEPIAWNGPGDTNRGGPASPGPNEPGRPGSPGDPGRPGSPGAAGSNPTSLSGDAPAQPSWWLWWEFNKLSWLAPDRWDAPDLPQAYDRTASEESWDKLRRELLPTLEEHLTHDAANVRAAAAVAYGRLGGHVAVKKLLELFDDPSYAVRRNALLALGATGSPEAAARLIDIVKEEGADVTPRAGAIATVALGLYRSRSAHPGMPMLLPDWCSSKNATRHEASQIAFLLQHTLAPSPQPDRFVHRMAMACDKTCRHSDAKKPKDSPLALQARAVEALPLASEEGVLPHLLHQVGGRDLELRRSAAVALGRVEDGAALQPLLTAFELEKEPLTRGLLLTAIGRRGGEEARDFLIKTLKTGPRATRAWTALALGILAREGDDDVARAAIRRASEKEKNHETVGAMLLASGIAQDKKAEERIRFALLDAKSADTRFYAAQALVLAAGDSGRDALLKAVEKESAPLTRTALAQALGIVGDARDAGVLVELLTEIQNPELQAQVAAALGFHGSTNALRGLVDALESPDLSQAGRGAALQAIGLLLDDERPFTLAKLSERSNFSVLPTWLIEPLQSSL